jgi:tartrate dehydrogenase/decarboxylase / D-malate dehydrogenase
MRAYRIPAIAADAIGREGVAAGLTGLQAPQTRDRGFCLAVKHSLGGSDYFRKYGRMMAEDGLHAIRRFDAICFGAIGDPGIPDHVPLWGSRLPICQGFDQYANVRIPTISAGHSGLMSATCSD